MNVDKNLIRHWAMLFESEEARMSGGETFIDENNNERVPRVLTGKYAYRMFLD